MLGFHEVEQHHAGFLVVVTRPPDGAECALRRVNDGAGIGRRNRQCQHALTRILRILWPEGIGLHEYHHATGGEILSAHLFGRTRCAAGDGFLHLFPLRHPAAEGTRGDDRLAIGRRFFKRDAGRALQFVHGALKRDAEPLADKARITLLERKRRLDTDFPEPARKLAAYTPDISEREPGELRIDRRIIEHHADAAAGRIFFWRDDWRPSQVSWSWRCRPKPGCRSIATHVAANCVREPRVGSRTRPD